MPIDTHLPQADPFSLVPTFKFLTGMVTDPDPHGYALKLSRRFKKLYNDLVRRSAF